MPCLFEPAHYPEGMEAQSRRRSHVDYLLYYLNMDDEGLQLPAKEKMVALIGVKDLIVVETDDALLVMSPDKAQDVKKVVNWLRDKGRTDLL